MPAQETTRIAQFRSQINQKYSLQLKDYDQLYQWSIDNIKLFWFEILQYFDVIYQGNSEPVLEDKPMNEIPRWFPQISTNYAENILRFNDQNVAIKACSEDQSINVQLTYAQLTDQVESFAYTLKHKFGLQKGDRLAAYVPNCVEAVVAFLACAKLGVVYSSTSCDFGETAVLDRFQQITPRVLLSVNAVAYNGKVYSHLDKLKNVVAGLKSLERVVLVPYIQSAQVMQTFDVDTVMWADTITSQKEKSFERLSFDHPLYILYSSGTTGQAKCITHGHGGPLLQHLKEHGLHSNMTRDDVFFQYTTTGWMMWQWLVAGLSVGATIILYDGSPFIPNGYAMWELCVKYQATRFGTSAKYIQTMQDMKLHPNVQNFDLSHLTDIFSTGSPLMEHNYEFIYQDIKQDVRIGSITGGTDIVSLFAGNCVELPVNNGEIQCRCLGMDVQAWVHEDELQTLSEGISNFESVKVRDGVYSVKGLSGDLICVQPFPCMPVTFWGDDDNQSKYQNAYFCQYEGVWYHGDYIWINPVTNGVVMKGRSDGILKPAGVRFGSAELYNILDKHFKDKVYDSLAIGQRRPQDQDERVVLFLKLNSDVEFSTELTNAIKSRIRKELSPRHVPVIFLPIQDIPYTSNGKKVEVAVKKILNGQKLLPNAIATLANPECLKLYENIPELM